MSSKFADLFQEANQVEHETITTAPKPSKKKAASVKKSLTGAANTAKIDKNAAQRVSGKRSDPSYTGVFAYVPATIHEDVKEKLVRKKDLDFSGLVEQLLRKWLKEQE